MDAPLNHINRLLMGRLLFLILVFAFGSGNAAASIILDDYQQSVFFIELDQSNSLTISDLILGNQDGTLPRKPLIPRINSYADYYQQADFLSKLKVGNAESIRAPPYLTY